MYHNLLQNWQKKIHCGNVSFSPIDCRFTVFDTGTTFVMVSKVVSTFEQVDTCFCVTEKQHPSISLSPGLFQDVGRLVPCITHE